MINREVIYERNLTGSYMKIPASYDAAFDEKMMLRKKLPGLLPVEKCYVDGGGQYWYNISGRQSLDTYCHVKALGIDFIEKIIVSICSEIEILEWNLLNADRLLLDPEFIFITNSNQEIIFTIYPGAKESVSKEFQQLMEFLLTKIDHKDAMAVQMAYAIYEKTLDDGYSIMDIRNLITENRNAMARDTEKTGKRVVETRKPENRIPDNRKQESKKSDNRQTANIKSENKKTDNTKTGGTKAGSTKASIWDKAKLAFFGEEKAAGTSDSASGSYQQMKNIWKEWKEKLKQNPSGRTREEKQRIQIVYPQEVYQEEAYQEEVRQEMQRCQREEKGNAAINPTICLSDYREHPEGLLLYEGFENFENIKLHSGTEKLGQGEGVDIVIPKNTISHFHAQIECREEEYYLEDLNSTNGTYINDVALSYKEKRKLCCNDIIRFADVKYRFI